MKPLLSTLAAALAALPLSVQAQAAPNAVPQLPGVTVTGQVVDRDDVRPATVSTATKTSIPLSDIPQTVDVVDTAKYRDYGITDLGTMLEGVPGVDATPDMRADEINIRGFSASYNDIYLDGMRSSGQVVRNTANIERIEVLKGPAAVLYGRGSGGGMVNMVSRHANFESPSTVSVRGGSWRTFGGFVDLNRVVSPELAVRLTADAQNNHSFRDGISGRSRMVSPSLLWDNGSGLRWLLQYTYDENWRVPDRGPSRETLPADVPIRNAFAHPDDFVQDTQHYARSDLSYTLGNDWNVRWVLGYRKAEQDFDHLYGGSYNATTGLIQSRLRAWQQTENTTVSSTLDFTGKADWLGVQHDLLFGLEASHERRQPRLATIRGEAPNIDPYDPSVWYQKTPQGEPTQHNRHIAKGASFYLQDLITFTPQWQVLLGARFERYTFDSLNRLNGSSRSYSDSGVSPRVGVIWSPVDNHHIYASYSKSFSPYGGRGLLSVSTTEEAVFDDQPQFSRQVEVGVKSDWLDGNLSSQISLFNLSKYNIRVQDEDDPFVWHVVGLERTRGVEFSFAGRVVDNWYLRGGISAQSPKVEQDHRPGRSGMYKTGVTRHNGNLYLRYAPKQGLYAETGVTYVGSRYLDVANTQKLEGYVRWDGLVGWRQGAWDVSAAVTNIADRTYWRSSSMPGAPRTFLVNAAYQF